jgi:autotransporter-associated beta strand protein
MHVWSGAVSELWSDPGNWSKGGSPASDSQADLVFPDTNVARFTSNNDINPTLGILSITFDGPNFDITGNSIAGGSKIFANNTVGNNQIDAGLHSLDEVQVQVASGGTLTIPGLVEALTGFRKEGKGTLILGSIGGFSAFNFLSGTTLDAGTLIVGNNNALGSGDLQLNGGTIQSGAASGAIITLANNFTVAGPVTISGSTDLTFTGTGHILTGQTLTVANTQGATFADGQVDFSGILFGPGSLTKTGTGLLALNGVNTYEGGTKLQGGLLLVGNDSALGTGTLTLSGGLFGNISNSVTLANSFKVTADTRVNNFATGDFPGPVVVSTFTFTGPGTLSAGATLTVTPNGIGNASTPIIFSGSLGGAGALTVDGGNDTVTLSGMNANTYTGATKVNSGTLFLNKPAGVTAIAGPLVIGDGVDNAEVKLGADNQLARKAAVTINALGTLKEGNHNLGAGSIGGPNHTNIIMGDPPTLTVGFDDSSTTFAGVISGPGAVVKVGAGTWTLTGASTYTGGTDINGGTLMVGDGGSIGAVTVNPGGTLAGTGTTGPVTLSPGVAISPGGSGPGILHVLSIAFAAGSSFVVRLNGPAAGAGYDQLQVTGSVDLGGATLSASLSPTFLPALGTAFTIITSTDTLSGAFAGHPDGDTFLLGGTLFQINYVNAAGNHAVVLSAIAYATTTSLTSSLSSSVYGQVVTFTATVGTVSAGAGAPTGTVTFQEGSTVLASAVPVGAGGQASFMIATLPAGPHTITAQYNAGSGFTASASSTGQTVNPAPLTVTANNQTKITGEANPTFTVSYSGFVLGQDPSVLGGMLTFSTPATTSSPPGMYAITPAGLTSGNYAITFVSGTLTVLSFAQATTNLVNQVTAANLDHGLANALVSILDAAIGSFNRGNNTAGVNQLGAFENLVRAQSGHMIDVALADALLAYAQRIINVVPG